MALFGLFVTFGRQAIEGREEWSVDGFRPCFRAASSSRIRRGVSRKTSSYVKQTGLIGTRLSFPPLFKIYTRQEAIRVGRLRPRATHRKRSEKHTYELQSPLRNPYA